ncbi:hypothetical protein BURKHO8Y_200036 [Burkholderia sp. 8Y]|nr:hypothetical protein BURKHO8Y_200036 [Burkholderia sp. 8Y]
MWTAGRICEPAVFLYDVNWTMQDYALSDASPDSMALWSVNCSSRAQRHPVRAARIDPSRHAHSGECYEGRRNHRVWRTRGSEAG